MASTSGPIVKVLAAKLPMISKEMEPAARQVVPVTAEEVRTLLRQRVPVWTGALMNSASVVHYGPYRADVGTNKVYGPVVHRDRPYISDALDAIEGRFAARVRRLVPGATGILPPMPSLTRYRSRMVARMLAGGRGPRR